MAFQFTKETIKDSFGIQEGHIRIVSCEEEGNRPSGPKYQVFRREPGEDGEERKPYVRAVIPMVSLDDDDNVIGEVDAKNFLVCTQMKNGGFILLPSEDGESPASNEEGEEGGVGAEGNFLVPMRPGATASPNMGMGRLALSMVELDFEFPQDISELVGVSGEIRTDEEKYNRKNKETGKEEEATSRHIVFASIDKQDKKKKGAAVKAKPAAKKAAEPEPEEEEGAEAGAEVDIEAEAGKLAGAAFKDLGKKEVSWAILVNKIKGLGKELAFDGDDDGELAKAVIEQASDSKWVGKLKGYKFDPATKKVSKG